MDNLSELITQILLLTIIVNAVTDRFKAILYSKSFKSLLITLFAIGVGVLSALTLKVDITMMINGKIDFVGLVLTGIIMSSTVSYIRKMFNEMKTVPKEAEEIAEEMVTENYLKRLDTEEISDLTTKILTEKGVIFSTEYTEPFLPEEEIL